MHKQCYSVTEGLGDTMDLQLKVSLLKIKKSFSRISRYPMTQGIPYRKSVAYRWQWPGVLEDRMPGALEVLRPAAGGCAPLPHFAHPRNVTSRGHPCLGRSEITWGVDELQNSLSFRRMEHRDPKGTCPASACAALLGGRLKTGPPHRSGRAPTEVCFAKLACFDNDFF